MKHILLIIAFLYPTGAIAFESKYSPTLKYVTSIGKWKQNNQSGFIRFISHATGSEHVISKLYIQWLTYHIDGEQESMIVAGKEIIELRGFEYTVPECNKKTKCNNFLLRAVESFGHFKSYMFVISIGKPGEYTLEKKAL